MLENKVVLVTGSAKRTGKAVALALATKGADVVVHYNRSKKEALRVVAAIQARGRKSYALQADISNPKEAERLVGRVVKRSGKIDILVNNVGNFIVKQIDKITAEEWNYMIKTTVSTSFYMCRATLPFMVKQNYGRIINMADSNAEFLRASLHATPYMIGKSGIIILTKSLGVRYGRYDITVNAISPGIIQNSMTKPKGGKNAIPKKRYTTPEDITSAMLFLIQSPYITGAHLRVDGGWQD